MLYSILKLLRLPAAAYEACVAMKVTAEVVTEQMHGLMVPRQYHNERVRELLQANNQEVERRRTAEHNCSDLEKQMFRLALDARKRAGVFNAFQWLQTIQDRDAEVLEVGIHIVIASFMDGYQNFSAHPGTRTSKILFDAHQKGLQAWTNHTALSSAASAFKKG